ncbi:hypothetical protein D3C73_838800 [compost metagenome]
MARVRLPASKSTLPPLLICTSDWSRRWAMPSPILSESRTSVSRCTSSAVVALSSRMIAVVLPSPRVTWPVASLAAVCRCTVPRVCTEVVANNVPCWRTSWPARVISPVLACTRPVLATTPAAASATLPAASGACSTVTSLPRVVEAWFWSVPMPLRITNASPAASVVCPLAVVIWPWLLTWRPSSST